MSDFRKLRVWQKAHAMALQAHKAATGMRGREHASLRSQIVRAAMSVPTNIVEGRMQKGEAAFARYLRIAIASAAELEYHVLAARDLGAISKSDHLALHTNVVEVRMMLHALVRRLEVSAERARRGASPTDHASP